MTSTEPNDRSRTATERSEATDTRSRKELEARIEQLKDRLAAVGNSTSDAQRKMSVIATTGLDMAYPSLILASTAAAFGFEVTVFHSCWDWTSSTRIGRRTSA